ncbi:MFS transporter [Aspergillus thermomutatus]|uniref:Major facilitator superfamily (MFS) profile domain-containing protein n=1 Tax=Aspergillus thermomutatus TaxID=41047 RepID=A0A397HCS9_ASPTH|nr:uncharacterized protein CDV56_107025 [Aspergillus thermomutatus]RHZ59808.1 hypothetical protein CDV56_107025 [Aspergillus thermomutatus]
MHLIPSLRKATSTESFTIFVVAFAVFTDVFLYSVIVPGLPATLGQRVGVPEADQQKWVSVLLLIYGAGLLIGSPICGYVADRVTSRKIPLMAGLVALGGATALLCAARAIALWVIGRFVQGVSAAVVWTVGLALLVDTVGDARIGEAMGYVGIGISLGVSLGPILGGVLYNFGGFFAVSESHPVFGSPEAQHVPNSEQSASRPSLLVLLTTPRVLVAMGGYFSQATLLTAFDSVLPLFVKSTFGWNLLGEGLIFLTLAVPAFLEPLIGKIVDKRHSVRRYMAAGGFLLAVPVLTLLRFVQQNSAGHIVLLCVLLFLVGVNMAVIYPPLMAEITNTVTLKEQSNPGIFGKKGAMAQAHGLMNCSYAAGSLVGPILGGVVREQFGWPTMSWVLAVFSAVASVPVALFLGGWIRR